MNVKIVLSAVLFAITFAAVHPVLAGPKTHPISQQAAAPKSAGAVPIRGDLHVFLKAF